jgi:hypothetical protein
MLAFGRNVGNSDICDVIGDYAGVSIVDSHVIYVAIK